MSSDPSRTEARRDAWQQWLAQHRRSLQTTSVWQLRFAETVLAQTPDLEPAWVFPEYPFTDAAGGARRMDFAVRRPDGDFIAIEVDGYDKTGTGLGMTHKEFDDFLRRQNSLVSQGWTLLRFSNHQVKNDPASCRTQLAAALARKPAATAPLIEARPVAPVPAAPVRAVASQPPSRRFSPGLWWAAGAVAVLGAVGIFALTSGGGGDVAGRTEPGSGGSCPSDFPLKANEESGIFHRPGQDFYNETRAEWCFADPASATAAGYRASRR